MYRLTPRMSQHLKRDLNKYHDLFDGGRCSGWELEELIVNAIKSDTKAQHHVFWREAGHDDKEDIRVRTNGESHVVQIKSGKLTNNMLSLSGHRLGRFNGDLNAITKYLKDRSANIISVAYDQIDNEQGRKHIYRVSYVAIHLLTTLSADAWEAKGRQIVQVNPFGVQFSLRPSMSWQIWWTIPIEFIELEELIEI